MTNQYREIGDLAQDELEIIKIRFWQKVDRRTESECWLWQASKRNKGYGAFGFTPRATGKIVQGRAHRFSYEIHKGPIGDLFVLHKCDTTACVNPRHLFLGTNQENVTDMIKKGRRVVGGTHKRDGYEKGEGHHNARLTESDIVEIRKMASLGDLSCSEIAKIFGISSTYAWKIYHRKAWKHVV